VHSLAKLPPSAFEELRIVLQRVPFNCLFAKAVLDGLAAGQVWSDRARAPTFAHIIHPYGMTLLVALSPDLNFAALAEHIAWCRQTIGSLWMQVYPNSLAPEIDPVLRADVAPAESAPNGVDVQRFTRCNFVFVPERYTAMAPLRPIPQDFFLRRMTVKDFVLPGIGVSPEYFWRNADEFIAQGGGWCIAENAKVISIAFTSFRLGPNWKLGSRHAPQYRCAAKRTHSPYRQVRRRQPARRNASNNIAQTGRGRDSGMTSRDAQPIIPVHLVQQAAPGL